MAEFAAAMRRADMDARTFVFVPVCAAVEGDRPDVHNLGSNRPSVHPLSALSCRFLISGSPAPVRVPPSPPSGSRASRRRPVLPRESRANRSLTLRRPRPLTLGATAQSGRAGLKGGSTARRYGVGNSPPDASQTYRGPCRRRQCRGQLRSSDVVRGMAG